MEKKRLAYRGLARLGRALFFAVLAGWFCWTGPAANAAPESGSCVANSESRQFDFWLGEWSVSYPGAPNASYSKVYLELGECVLVENWSGGKSHQGINIFAYSADDRHWHGMFADNEGRVHVFEGKVAAGSAEFLGPSRGPNGEAVLNRIRVVRLGPDRVEESWEKSSDNGSTWSTVFRGEYTRKDKGKGAVQPGR
jgi:hypothetical protein